MRALAPVRSHTQVRLEKGEAEFITYDLRVRPVL